MRPDDFMDGFGPCAAVLAFLFLIGKGIQSTVRQARLDHRATKESRARHRALQEDDAKQKEELRQEMLPVAVQEWRSLQEWGYVREWAHR